MQIVFGLGSAVTANCPIHGPATADCATAVNVTDNNAILPNRPIFGVRFDPTTELIAYAAVGGFNANTPSTPGHVFQVTCAANCATFTWKDKTGNLPDIPAEPLGGRIMYTFTLTNNGPSVANDVSLDTTLAAGFVFAGNSGDCTGAFPCAFGTLQPGDIKTVNTTACVPGNYSGNLLIKTTGTASTSSSDPNTDNNTASAYTSLAYDVLFGDGFETCP